MYWDDPAGPYGEKKKQAGPYSEESLAMNPIQASTGGIITMTAPGRNAALLERGNANVAGIFSAPWNSPPAEVLGRKIPQFSYSPKGKGSAYGELPLKDGKKLYYLEKNSLQQ